MLWAFFSSNTVNCCYSFVQIIPCYMKNMKDEMCYLSPSEDASQMRKLESQNLSCNMFNETRFIYSSFCISLNIIQKSE